MCHAFTVPEGWRVPSKDEYMNEVGKSEEKDYLSVQGDFNGDGVEDEARLLVTTDGKKMGVVVWLSDRDQQKLYILGEEDAWLRGMGIDLALPGQYETACGKGYFDCGPGESKLLDLRYHAINYFWFSNFNWYEITDIECVQVEHDLVAPWTFSRIHFLSGNACSFYFWDFAKSEFKRTWISD